MRWALTQLSLILVLVVLSCARQPSLLWAKQEPARQKNPSVSPAQPVSPPQPASPTQPVSPAQNEAPTEGVTDREILIGMSAAFKGASRSLGIELYRGSMAYFT